MNVVAFDIETIPDVNAGRRLLNISSDLSDADVARAMFQRRSLESGAEFQPHYLHQIIAISLAYRSQETFHVLSLGTPESTEKELVERFFSGVEKRSPTLVTWNGSGFDLPVLHYRGLLHGVKAERYWENGDDDTHFRWNNYLNRYHYRHTDLMEVLAGFQMRARAPLNEIALLLGFPGKMGMDGADVWPSYLNTEIDAIRNYCETDALNTYLIYLRWELMRGRLSEEQYADECILVHDTLSRADAEHLRLFASAWGGPR